MAARTVESGYFGSVGMGDPESTFAERTLRVSWDFGKKNVPENKTIPLLKIPKGFCIDRISVVQTVKASSAVTVTFGLASDDSVTVGGNFALVATGTLLRSSQDPDATNKTALFVTSDDTLCMVVPDGVTGDKVSAGAFDLCIHGFETFAEGVGVGDGSVYRPTLQTQDNVSGGMMPLD